MQRNGEMDYYDIDQSTNGIIRCLLVADKVIKTM